MKAKNVQPFAAAGIAVAALAVLLGATAAAMPDARSARGGAASYTRMAALDQYLIKDPQAEIALARSAAPAAISGKATILVLKPQGYETAVKGSNDFTCLVERAWMSPFDSAEFWNPKMRAPVCYNPAASRSVLLYSLWRTKRALAGHSREQLLDEVRAALARSELPAPEQGAMSFMMSKDAYFGDAVGHWHSHLMFHLPKTAAGAWGANLPDSPVLLDNRDTPEESIFMVPVGHWSDGTETPGS